MEARNSPVVARKLWDVLRITFFMIRKGLISKRKMVMDVNVMMKKGKLLRKSLSNLIHHHHHHPNKSMTRVVTTTQGYYEFSCNNSPNPVFFHMPKRNKHHFITFPCIHSPEVLEDDDEPQFSSQLDEIGACGDDEAYKAVVLIPKTPEYTFNFAPGEKKSPLLSPFSVRVSNYSALDENEEIGSGQVDDQAEEFIRRFYEQLRTQSRMQLLHYQDL